MNPADANQQHTTITAKTLEELNKLMQDMVEQGWHAESAPIHNPDGSYSVTMTK